MLHVVLPDTVLLIYKQPGQSKPQSRVTQLQESPALGLVRPSRHKPPRQTMGVFHSTLQALPHQVSVLEMPPTQVRMLTSGEHYCCTTNFSAAHI